MTAHDEKRIAEIVRHWPTAPMTWELIVDKVTRDLEKPAGDPGKKKSAPGGWSRQALSGRASIKKAYDTRQKELTAERERVTKRPTRNRDPELVILRRERDDLRIANEELKARLALYEEKLGLRVHNRALGKPDDKLEEPMKPKIDRLGRT